MERRGYDSRVFHDGCTAEWVFRSLCCTLCQFTCLYATYRLHRGEEEEERRAGEGATGEERGATATEGGEKATEEERRGGARRGLKERTEGNMISDKLFTANLLSVCEQTPAVFTSNIFSSFSIRQV